MTAPDVEADTMIRRGGRTLAVLLGGYVTGCGAWLSWVLL